jgi:hypothetical protein
MTTLGTFKYDNLFAGSAEVITGSVVAGAKLTRGTVVGLISATEKAVAVDSTKADGSEKPYGIVAEDVEIDKPAIVYLTGEFNQSALTFGGTDTAGTHKIALRNIGIFLKGNIEA